jgi:thiosulfate/3-mercaptopyruvate sulfurtransferase
LALLYRPADLTADQQIIPYCSSGVRSAVTYFTLRQMGYDNVALFTGSFDEWVSDPSRPVER